MKDYFKDMYTDFFEIESLPKKEIKEITKESSADDVMQGLFLKIDKLYVDSDSKELLKKIITYMRKYNEGLEKKYIPFRLVIDVTSNPLLDEITAILYEAATYFNYLINNKKQIISLYKLDKASSFSDFGINTIGSLTGININNDTTIKQFFHDVETYLKLDSKAITIITGNTDELQEFFLGHGEFKNKYQFMDIKGHNPDIQEIYNEIIDTISDESIDRVNLLDYITNTYNEDTDYYEYKNSLINYMSFNKTVPTLVKEKTIDEVFASLNELVGLANIKQVLHELVDVITLKDKAGDKLNIKDINLHMVFLGNPGTGKTTIARLIANILYDLKYIKENKLIEVSVKDLVAEYVGQTAPKTMSVIEKSLNGVLFIDEAYALASDNNNSYNAEAIATLIQAMENYRDKLVVIFAGYTNEMQKFLNSNSGIASRIGYTLEFADYTTDELIDIFLGMTNKAGFVVEEDAIIYLKEIIEKYRGMKNFGNARFVRNIYEKTVVRHAANVKDKKQLKILKTITKKDISYENLILE